MTPAAGGSAAALRAPAVSAFEDLRAQALPGLLAPVKTLPPILFYDAHGARLFEAICETPEYYVTRTETAILEAFAPEIASLAGKSVALIEYGSGAGVKVRHLLDALEHPAAYVPVDISEAQLLSVAAERKAQYPQIRVIPLCRDYSRPFDVDDLPTDARRLAFFPGSSIGNFHPTEAAAFLHRVRRVIGPRGAMVLGVDRRKDERVLHAAYNDAGGVTAAFNLNVLERLNHELDADFDLTQFRHKAFFNQGLGRIEMHLQSLRTQYVTVDGVRIRFAEGETILTECSYKYDRRRLDAVVNAAGFSVAHLWTDERDWFWVVFLEPS